jgi:acyl dehydratase
MEAAHAVRFTRTRRLVARFRAPVLPGDTLWAETELQSTGVAPDGSTQVAIFRDVATNQRGDTVAELERHVAFLSA